MKIKFAEKQLKQNLGLFLVIAAGILLFFVIYRFHVVKQMTSGLVHVVSPFLYGLVFAYLLCPIYNLTRGKTYRLLSRKVKRPRRALSIAKGIATLISMLVFCVVVVGISWMILPGLVESVTHIISILPDSVSHFITWIDSKTTPYPEMQAFAENWINRITDNVIDYVQSKLLPNYLEVATSISTGVFGVFNVVKNVFIGIIVCIYFLNSKEMFAAQSKKLLFATCKEERAAEILAGAAFTNKTFGGFINGKIIDSMIIGAICFIVMTVLNWEYALLISCIIGLTNIIPFFGPFIGAVPSALLLLMGNPVHCIYFLIFILILQQVDGNIIGPKILGDSTGLSSFWVMFAILVGGGLFGFVGMVIGIPVFAVIYAYCSRAINRRLGKRGFSTDTQDYMLDIMERYKVRETKRGKKEEREDDRNDGGKNDETEDDGTDR